MNENTLRDALAARGRSLYERGYAHGSSGNLSVRLPDGILVTPTGSSLGRLDPARLAKVAPDGTPVSGDPPSKEAFLHLAMYAARPAAQAIVHLHCTCAVAVSCLVHVDPRNVLPPRHNQMREERQVIAKLAVGLASPGDVLMLESGSTILHFAQQLAASAKDLTVVTPSPYVAVALAHNPSITVILCPGTLNAREGTVLGPETVGFLEQFNANLAFVGSSGITVDGLNETLTGMAIVKRAILARARRRVALLDHSKFNQPSLAVAGALSDLNTLVTDQAPDGELASALNRAGVRVILPGS